MGAVIPPSCCKMIEGKKKGDGNRAARSCGSRRDVYTSVLPQYQANIWIEKRSLHMASAALCFQICSVACRRQLGGREGRGRRSSIGFRFPRHQVSGFAAFWPGPAYEGGTCCAVRHVALRAGLRAGQVATPAQLQFLSCLLHGSSLPPVMPNLTHCERRSTAPWRSLRQLCRQSPRARPCRARSANYAEGHESTTAWHCSNAWGNLRRPCLTNAATDRAMRAAQRKRRHARARFAIPAGPSPSCQLPCSRVRPALQGPWHPRRRTTCACLHAKTSAGHAQASRMEAHRQKGVGGGGLAGWMRSSLAVRPCVSGAAAPRGR